MSCCKVERRPHASHHLSKSSLLKELHPNTLQRSRRMINNRRTKQKAKSSSTVVGCFVAWFIFRTIPLIYYRVARSKEDAERKWEKDYADYQFSDVSIPTISGLFALAKGSMSELVAYIGSSREMCWFVLLLSIFAETGATTLSKYASEKSSAGLLALSCFMVIISQCGMTASLAKIDVSTAYAIWAALGTATVSIAGMTLFSEGCDTTKLISLSFIILGVVGLNLREHEH